jgi:hypothetical protein
LSCVVVEYVIRLQHAKVESLLPIGSTIHNACPITSIDSSCLTTVVCYN